MKNSMGKISSVLVLFLLALPAGVMAAPPISTIAQGNTVFLGEEGLDITAALNGAYYGVSCGYSMNASEENSDPPLTQIGWWASAANIYNSAPSRTIDVGSRYTSMMIAPSEFAGYTGNWYLLGPDGRAHSADVPGCGCTASRLHRLPGLYRPDPNLDIRVMDATLGVDATSNGWITTGSEVAFKITTNLYQIGQRPGVSGSADHHPCPVTRRGQLLLPDQQKRRFHKYRRDNGSHFTLFNGRDLGYRQVRPVSVWHVQDLGRVQRQLHEGQL